jgi:hypothetical protein
MPGGSISERRKGQLLSGGITTDEERNAIDALLLLHMRSDGTWSDGHAKLTETLLRFAKLSISGRGPTERRNAPQ